MIPSDMPCPSGLAVDGCVVTVGEPDDAGLAPGVASELLTRAAMALLVLDGPLVRYANPAAAELLGGRLDTLVGHPWLDHVAVADRATVCQLSQERLAGVPGHVHDVQCLRADGSVFDARVRGQALTLDGRTMNLVTVQDITELKRALRRAEANADFLARSEALCLSGSFELSWPQGRITPSAGLCALVERGPDSLAQDDLDHLSWVLPDDRSLVAEAWRAAVPDVPFELQHRILTGSGAERVVRHRGVLQSAERAGEAPCGMALLQDVTQQLEAENRLQELANFDEVTGLPNRSSFLEQVESRIETARWDDCALGLLFITVPRIEDVRATLGLGAGDALAMALAARLSAAVTDNELVAHVGGSDFAMLFSQSGSVFDPEAAGARARALRLALQAPVRVGESDMFVWCQIGLAGFPGDADRAAALFEAAQTASRNADASGGIAFVRPESNARAVRELQLAGALRHAIDQEELSLVYQPQVSLASGAIVGAEALMRWHHPEWGEVAPTEFIPLAERAGLIDELGDWVLHQVCLQAVAWQNARLPRIRLALNVSPLQFRQGDVARQVQRALLQTGVDPACLAIELTESTLMEQTERASAMLSELKALGVEIALDDFGTGYSSLSCLRSLPIDVVKVDRSFVNDVTAAPESASVTRSIITMAHALQMRVLAEGVETEAQLSLLLDKGCDQIQGFWFSHPVTADVMAQMLREGKRLPEQLTSRRQRKRTLLLVDDEENILSALKRLFRRDGYQIITATNAAEGLVRLAERSVDVILSDQRMPGMTGVEFLTRAKDLYPDTVRMTLSGFTDLQSIIDAVNEGAIYKFLTKPWDDERLRAHVDEAFRRKELADDNRRLAGQVATANAELAGLNQRLEAALERQREQALLLQASAGGVRDLLDELPATVLGIDPDGLLAYANDQARASLGEADTRLGEPAAPWLLTLAAQVEQQGLRSGATPQAPPALGVQVHGHACLGWCTPVLTHDGCPRGRLLMLVPAEGQMERTIHA